MSRYQPDAQQEHNRDNNRAIDNTPAWMKEQESVDTPTASANTVTFADDKSSKKPHLSIVYAGIFASSAKESRPMPLELDNSLPAINLCFGSTDDNEVVFPCHVDSCAAMNAGNLRVHQWVITHHPEIVTKYLQFDDLFNQSNLSVQLKI